MKLQPGYLFYDVVLSPFVLAAFFFSQHFIVRVFLFILTDP